MCVAALSGNACETWLLADEVLSKIKGVWYGWLVYHTVSRLRKKADGGSKIRERQWVRERLRLEASGSAGCWEKKSNSKRKWTHWQIFPTSTVFSDVSASEATHSFRYNADHFLPYLSTSLWYGLAVASGEPWDISSPSLVPPEPLEEMDRL